MGKNKILDCIILAELDNQTPVTTTAVLNGGVLIQIFHSGSGVTIGDYFIEVLYHKSSHGLKEMIELTLSGIFTPRISWKSETREQRSSGTGRRVTF